MRRRAIVGGLPSLLAGSLVGVALQQFEAVFVLGRLEAMLFEAELSLVAAVNVTRPEEATPPRPKTLS
jgi:hypothetical protein